MIGLNTCPDCKEKFPEGRDHKCDEPWTPIPEPSFRIGDKVLFEGDVRCRVVACLWCRDFKEYRYDLLDAEEDINGPPYCDVRAEALTPWSKDQDSELITLEELQSQLNDLSGRLTRGCTNHGCLINPPTGMGTNAICNCTPRYFEIQLHELSRRLDQYGHKRQWRKD